MFRPSWVLPYATFSVILDPSHHGSWTTSQLRTCTPRMPISKGTSWAFSDLGLDHDPRSCSMLTMIEPARVPVNIAHSHAPARRPRRAREAGVGPARPPAVRNGADVVRAELDAPVVSGPRAASRRPQLAYDDRRQRETTSRASQDGNILTVDIVPGTQPVRGRTRSPERTRTVSSPASVSPATDLKRSGSDPRLRHRHHGLYRVQGQLPGDIAGRRLNERAVPGPSHGREDRNFQDL